jgi:hypothetical protein
MQIHHYEPISRTVAEKAVGGLRFVHAAVDGAKRPFARKLWDLPASDQSFDILVEMEQFCVSNPGWDRGGLVAAARCSFEDGASRERVAILYGDEIAKEVCK